ncbi:DUF3606 domain-containing protein [Flavobacterium pallidum]|uniref:DUF3606 domain-containing protein n=1 Tax=Flavobacterium pallidum TaxID=2172098 RepID=A0A2S1SHB9_9FLAO|nr:DUF3606 domain-containing protein [Flavobacterium pallidum]AWI25803.1 hypothetical protein HYN49_07750 [Flavobacterium pallidum]
MEFSENDKAGYRGVIAVNLDNKEEVAHWMEHWDVTETQLREAVAGCDSNLVSAIAAYLKR